MSVEQIASLASDIFVGLSAIIVAVLAIYGVKTWRKELTGRAKFELARKIMLLSQKVEDAFKGVRFPITSSQEWSARHRDEKASEEEQGVLDGWYAKAERLKPLVENLRELQEAGWEAEVLLRDADGGEVSAAIKSFRESYGDLSSAISSYFDVRLDGVKKGQPYHDQDWLRELSKKIFSATNDDFEKKVSSAKDKISVSLKKYVK